MRQTARVGRARPGARGAVDGRARGHPRESGDSRLHEATVEIRAKAKELRESFGAEGRGAAGLLSDRHLFPLDPTRKHVVASPAPTLESRAMTPDQKAAFARTFPVHVGVDTGKRFHVLVARGPDGQRRKPMKVLVSREGFERADLIRAVGLHVAQQIGEDGLVVRAIGREDEPPARPPR